MIKLSNRSFVAGAIVTSILLSGLLSGCATRPPVSEPLARAEYDRINDPLEPLNRATHDFNMTMDRFLLAPIADVYRWILPDPLRRGISNMISNLQAPLIFTNDLLQGEFDRSGVTLARFLTNSTLGVAGLWDPASKWGLEKHKEDFGETLAVWGVGEGFYLVLPFFGPSNPRDAVGTTVEFFGDPVSLYLEDEGLKKVSYGRTAITVIDYRDRNRETINSLQNSDGDFYVLMRTAYRQNRAHRIANGRDVLNQQEEDLFEEELQ